MYGIRSKGPFRERRGLGFRVGFDLESEKKSNSICFDGGLLISLFTVAWFAASQNSSPPREVVDRTKVLKLKAWVDRKGSTFPLEDAAPIVSAMRFPFERKFRPRWLYHFFCSIVPGHYPWSIPGKARERI